MRRLCRLMRCSLACGAGILRGAALCRQWIFRTLAMCAYHYQGCLASVCLCRVAVDGQLWAIALLLSRLLGEAATAGTAGAMVQQCVAQQAPLQTLLLLLGGASAEQPLAAAAAAAVEAAAPAAEAPPATAWQTQPGMFNPAAASAAAPGAGGSNDPTAWRRHLAVMAANRTPGDEAAMLSLGSQLLAAGQLLPAHVAFMLAGSLLQPWDLAAAGNASGAPAAAAAEAGKPASPAQPLVLLGTDAAVRPRACAQLPAILATEVYTWSRTVGELCS